MTYRPDIVLKDRGNAPVAAIEAKAGSQVDPSDAMRLFEAVHRQLESAGTRFLMLVTPRFLTLWDLRAALADKQNGGNPKIQLPAPRYVTERLPASPRGGHSFHLLIYQWLIKLREFGADEADPAEQGLVSAGFVDAIRDAQIELESAA